MLTKTKIVLAAVLFAGTASIASAQEFDPNLANRYPAYNGPAAATQSFQSAPVRRSRTWIVTQCAAGRRRIKRMARAARQRRGVTHGSSTAHQHLLGGATKRSQN